MRARFKSALGFIMMLLIIAIVLFAFYFVYKKMRSSDGDIKITGDLSINFHNGKKIKIDKEFKTKITVINNGNEDIYYYIEFINPKNASGVTYTLTDNALINVSDELPKHNEIISSYILIKKGEIHDYELTFKNTLDNVASVELDCEQETLNNNTFAETILKNNEIKSESKTIVGKDIATENEGLIKTVDDYGIAYYFRGNVQNNNVSINNLNFKIVRINGDGSVRLALANDTGELKKYVDSNEKYSYKDSVIRAYLDSWITINLGDYTSFLATQKYCNDVLLNDNTFYAYTRVVEDYIPSFICLSDKVTSKVALLTVDEVLFAGASPNEENTYYYLYNESIETDSFLMSSSKLVNGIYYPFALSKNGKVLSDVSGSFLRSVRPVITIIKTALVEGDGTSSNPYKLISN